MKIQGAENYYNQIILFVSEGEVSQSLYSLNSSLAKVRVEKKYPNTLQIFPYRNMPLAYLKVDQGYFLLADDGRILSKQKNPKHGFPVITHYQKLHYLSYQAGDKIEFKDITTALHFTKNIGDLGLKVDSIDINGLNMIRLHIADKMVLFTTEKEIKLQDYQLEKLIRQLKVEGKDFEVLDLRFEKPIIIFKN